MRGLAEVTRVVRGGSFNNNARNVRCAVRNRNDPDNRNDNNGFRVVVSHGLLAGLQSLPPVLCAGYGLRSAVGGQCSQFLAASGLLPDRANIKLPRPLPRPRLGRGNWSIYWATQPRFCCECRSSQC
ncbi:MAG: SUMF1/EgtB/PvdO family nonheme iron enzyme [Anaerolineae bacterium]|nr:SUMF1/EgtB/PvdO family nonheme iron enzyme [Anaerolineae bacterium]